MNPTDIAQDFIDQLRDLCQAGSPSGPIMVGARVLPDSSAVIIYRERAGSPVLGRRYDLTTYSRLFSPDSSARHLAEIAYADDLTDPSGSGTRLHVDWADGVVADPHEIGWLLSHDELRDLT